MCGPAVAVPIIIAAAAATAKAVGGVMEGLSGAEAAKQEADMARRQAIDAEYRGGIEAGEVTMQGSRVAGEQRVGLVAAGIDLQSDFAENLLADTRTRSSLDADTVLANARREAWGYRMEEATARWRKKVAGRKTVLAAAVPFFEFGADAAKTYYGGQKSTSPSSPSSPSGGNPYTS